MFYLISLHTSSWHVCLLHIYHSLLFLRNVNCISAFALVIEFCIFVICNKREYTHHFVLALRCGVWNESCERAENEMRTAIYEHKMWRNLCFKLESNHNLPFCPQLNSVLLRNRFVDSYFLLFMHSILKSICRLSPAQQKPIQAAWWNIYINNFPYDWDSKQNKSIRQKEKLRKSVWFCYQYYVSKISWQSKLIYHFLKINTMFLNLFLFLTRISLIHFSVVAVVDVINLTNLSHITLIIIINRYLIFSFMQSFKCVCYCYFCLLVLVIIVLLMLQMFVVSFYLFITKSVFDADWMFVFVLYIV